MKNLVYRLFATGFQAFIWKGALLGKDNLPEQGPAVFVANHLESLGPIAVVSSMPYPLYPWVVSNMLDAEHAPEYLRWDFVERQSHFEMPQSLWIAKAISKISVPLLNWIECIPVFSTPDNFQITFDRSVDLLARGNFLLIFPEDPTSPKDTLSGMSPFKKGFVRLGEYYYQRTARPLHFYPLAVHAAHRTVQVGIPVMYNPFTPPSRERLRIKRKLEQMIRDMLTEKNGSIPMHFPQVMGQETEY